MKKILSVVGIIFLVSLMFVLLVSASYVCPAAQTDTTTLLTGKIYGNYPTEGYSAHGVAFTANSTGYLYNASIWLLKTGAITGNLTAWLTNVQGGTVGTNAYPGSSVYDHSAIVDISTIGGSYSYVTFDFTGTYQILNATDYVLYIWMSDESDGSSTSYVSWGGKGIDATKNNCYYIASTWYANFYDPAFILNGDTTISPDPTPTPSPSPTPDGSDGGDVAMEELVDAILPFLVPLLICLIPALLAYKFVGELGFFIGLNVGVILAYVTLANSAYAFPLWGIILVGVMDVAVVLMRR